MKASAHSTIMKGFKVALIMFAAIFAVLQFFRPDRTNPTVVEAENITAAMAIPAEVDAILSRSCKDCHSHETEYPWYSNVSPASWFLVGHITEARKHMNFSVWNTYSSSKQARRLEEICEEITAGAMPLPSYLWLHRDAVLSEADKQILCEWSSAEKARIERKNTV